MSSESVFGGLSNTSRCVASCREPRVLCPGLDRPSGPLERFAKVEPDVVGVRPKRQRPLEFRDCLRRLIARDQQAAMRGVRIGAVAAGPGARLADASQLRPAAAPPPARVRGRRGTARCPAGCSTAVRSAPIASSSLPSRGEEPAAMTERVGVARIDRERQLLLRQRPVRVARVLRTRSPPDDARPRSRARASRYAR